MADNLNITIGADTSKARYEMELLNAKMQATQKEIKATRTEAAKGDPKAIQNLKDQTAAIDAMSKRVVVLKKEVNSFGKELTKVHEGGHAHKFYLVEQSLQNLNGAFMAIGHNIGGARAAIAGFAVGIAFTKIIETVNEATKGLIELKKQAGEIGVRPVALQAVREIAREAGKDADDATKVLQGLGKVIEENRAKFNAPVGSGAGLPTVLSAAGTLGGPTPGRIGMPGGPTVRVGRGGVPGLTDPTKALDDLDLTRFKTDAMGVEQQALAVEKRIIELHKTMSSLDFNIFAKAKFGVSGETLFEQVEQQIAKTLARIEKLNAAARGATKEHLDQVERLAAAQGKLITTRQEALAGGIALFTELDIAITTALTHFFEAPWRQKFSELWTGIGQDWNSVIAGMASAWTSFTDGIVSAAAAAANSIRSALSGIGGALSSAAGVMLDAASKGGGMPFARGGYVTGPGSATSDSIMARLSAGEFVVNAGAVRQLGLGFMRQLNGFANGGLVGPLPRFAEGGLVSGGTPVHLHLDGQSFAMSAEGGVAQALVVASRRYQMRSAGIKPSWYGGRPGG